MGFIILLLLLLLGGGCYRFGWFDVILAFILGRQSGRGCGCGCLSVIGGVLIFLWLVGIIMGPPQF